MRSRLMTAALAAAMLAGAGVSPAAAQAPGLEGLVEDAREGVPVPEDGYAAEDWEAWLSRRYQRQLPFDIPPGCRCHRSNFGHASGAI